MTRHFRSALSIFALLLLIILIIAILQAGKNLEIPSTLINAPKTVSDVQIWLDGLHHPLAIFLLQLIIIIGMAQLLGWIFRRFGQPSVMGEIIAGILLGPSFLGMISPHFFKVIFPKESLTHINMLSQIGLVLFMFVIGMELDLRLVKAKIRSAVYISNVSILLPFSLGVLLSYFLYKKFAPAHIPFYAFALFIGVAMSITAFPVLARIIRERKIATTTYGAIAMTSAAANDITGWCLLAFVIAIVKAGSITASLFTLFTTAIYVALMLVVVKKLLHRLATIKVETKEMRASTLAVIFSTMLISAYCSEIIGIHALFGAFIAGVVMPEEWSFRQLIIHKIEDVALVLLLPLFFVYTGLRTEIGVLTDPTLWGLCVLVIVIAIVGKLGGGALAARIKGETWLDSIAIGALMNTRGLMELVILNIGFDLGILSPEIFTIFVVMALVTTLLTCPILSLLNRIEAFKKRNDHLVHT
ncbi:MAG: cation:proton antiporter [Bacteroidetes bacterium]|nr:cation:proton antiporter [Bacteroidota bacterium]MBS1739078.1 cation:proton antiporter [Bacteroidota bacterium]MBS1775889.1 cation:proton antiporter [Bacteroidota bacterium]